MTANDGNNLNVCLLLDELAAETECNLKIKIDIRFNIWAVFNKPRSSNSRFSCFLCFVFNIPSACCFEHSNIQTPKALLNAPCIYGKTGILALWCLIMLRKQGTSMHAHTHTYCCCQIKSISPELPVFTLFLLFFSMRLWERNCITFLP